MFDVNIVTFSGSLKFRTEWSKSSFKRRYGSYCDVTLHGQCTLFHLFLMNKFFECLKENYRYRNPFDIFKPFKNYTYSIINVFIQ